MNNKILALVALTGLALGASASNAQELTVTANAGFETEYVFRGVELADDSYQASIDFAYGDYYASIWTNQPTADNEANEVDYTAGYLFSVNEDITADVGVIVYDYPDTPGDNETIEGFIGFTYDAAKFATPSIYTYYDFDLESITVESSLARTFNVAEKQSVETAAHLGFVNEDGPTKYYYYGVSADYVYSFNETMAAKVGLRVTENDDHRGPNGRDNNVWGGFSFTAGF